MNAQFRAAMLGLAFAGSCADAPCHAAAKEVAPPRLIVVVSVDQLSSNLFDAARIHSEQGFARLNREGVVYPNAYYAHAMTETCAGHASILSGKHPNKTGIIANSWYDASAGKVVYCVADDAYVLAHDASAAPRGPTNLQASTLGDWIKTVSPRSRVVALAGKDRAAITLAPHRADGVFWFQPGFGFTTYVGRTEQASARLEPVTAFNRRFARRKIEESVWRYAHERCAALEATYELEGQRWTSRLPPMDWAQSDKAATAAEKRYYSPITDALTLEAARELIEHYRLGQDEAVDLLAIGLSATDLIGHRYGTAGPEMCDHLHRLDEELGRFLSMIAKTNPEALVVLTADHGGSDFPERLAQQGYPAVRLDPQRWLAALNEKVRQQLAIKFSPLVAPGGLNNQLYAVDAAGRALTQPLRSKVLRETLALLAQDPNVNQAFDLEDLLTTPPDASAAMPDELSLRSRMALSTFRGRSGDLMIAFGSNIAPVGAQPGKHIATHGTPYTYDRRVPVIFWRPRARHELRPLPIQVVDIAPTLARIIGVPMPADVDGRALDLDQAGY